MVCVVNISNSRWTLAIIPMDKLIKYSHWDKSYFDPIKFKSKDQMKDRVEE